MKSRAYWFGLVIVSLALLAGYRLISLPQTYYVLTGTQDLLPRDDKQDPANHPQILRAKLAAQGITFPPGSRVYRPPHDWATDTYIRLEVRPTLCLKNTWRNHQKLSSLEALTGPVHQPTHFQHSYFSFQIGHRTFGFWENNSATLSGPDEARPQFRPSTTIAWGSEGFGYRYEPYQWLTLYPDQQHLTYNYRAWPLLLILALAAYSIAYSLRKPMWRAMRSLIQRRRARA